MPTSALSPMPLANAESSRWPRPYKRTEPAVMNATGNRCVFVDDLHHHITVSDGELEGERAPTRLIETTQPSARSPGLRPKD
jgi:hypothetical protein